VNPLRSVGGRLALALLVVVGGALAIVYLIVVSSYRSSLVNTRLKDMSHTVALIAAKPRPAPGEVFPSAEWIEDEALPVAGGARVAIFSSALGEPVADSNGGTSVDIERDPLVRRAERSQGIVSSAVERDGSTYAEAAVALKGGSVLFVSSPLHSDLTSLSVVRRRVLLAVIAATAFAIVLGYALATLFARRIRRLEAAAERIADGRFDEPVLDDAPDELGQLARAFEQMRLRLASLDRARGEFIANASHELRTPLFSLAGFLELLDTDENVDAETREEFLASMRVQVARLTKLASDLLDLSRMDAGRLAVSDETFDLAVVADELATEFGPRAAATGHSLELAAPDGAYARADEGRALQIGRILIDNAFVHTPRGTTVSISAGETGGSAALVVEDDGPGIPAESSQAVFDRFYRLDGSIASGSGLGLAIARELAELMGGRIELESRPGFTRFALVLPPDEVARPTELAPARKG
jgi:two-component system, OmpR family, sensor kinase